MRETPYIILLLLVIVAAALFLGNSDPITAATGRVEVNAVFADVPAGGFIASGLLGALFKIVLSGIGLSISGLVVVQMRKWLRDRQYNSQWKGGPNAQWQQRVEQWPEVPTRTIKCDDERDQVEAERQNK